MMIPWPTCQEGRRRALQRHRWNGGVAGSWNERPVDVSWAGIRERVTVGFRFVTVLRGSWLEEPLSAIQDDKPLGISPVPETLDIWTGPNILLVCGHRLGAQVPVIRPCQMDFVELMVASRTLFPIVFPILYVNHDLHGPPLHGLFDGKSLCWEGSSHGSITKNSTDRRIGTSPVSGNTLNCQGGINCRFSGTYPGGLSVKPY